MKKRLVSILLVLCCLLTLAGCGADPGKSTPAGTLPTGSSPQTAVTPNQPDEPSPIPVPEGPHYILNTNSKKFHESDCGSAGNINTADKDYYTGTAEELIAMGYTPCGNCRPSEHPTPEPEPSPEPEPTPEPEPEPSEVMVWIPASGSKYHSNPSCSNMKNPSEVPKSQAEAEGYTPCKKCW